MNALILDPAHGKDVAGKRSPDNRHFEWKWSRDRIRFLMHELCDMNNINFYFHCPFLSYDTEPGLTTRVLKYNEISKEYDKTVTLSLHNDANHIDKCDDKGWGKGHGLAFWTSKGETPADKYVDFMIERFEANMPHEHFRKAFWLGEGEKVKDADYEADFTVLAGNKRVKPIYEGILMEVLFQNNLKDVEKLLDPNWNLFFDTVLLNVIVDLFDNIDKI